MITLYRGVEQLVARRAHNPKVAWFKSRPRNQTKKKQFARTAFSLFLCRIRFISRIYGLCDRRALLVGRSRRAHPVGDEARRVLLSGQNLQRIKMSVRRFWEPRAGKQTRSVCENILPRITLRSRGSSPVPATSKKNLFCSQDQKRFLF